MTVFKQNLITAVFQAFFHIIITIFKNFSNETLTFWEIKMMIIHL